MALNVIKSIGEIARELREKHGYLLREVSAQLEIDPSLLSKIERGDKRPTKSQILQLSRILKVDEKELMIAYLSDKIVYHLKEEDLAVDALKVAELKIEYLKNLKKDQSSDRQLS